MLLASLVRLAERKHLAADPAFEQKAVDFVLQIDHQGRFIYAVDRRAPKGSRLVGAPMEMLLPARYRSAHFGHRMRFHRAPQVRSMGAGLELYGLRRDGQDSADRLHPRAVHPVIATHPFSGRKTLYVNSVFTTRINELTDSESADVLAFLFEHVTRPDFQCRFRWRRHSIAFWDNRATQHYAVWDYYPAVRSGRRVTIRGDRPRGGAAT